MKVIASTRTEQGSGASRRLRTAGFTPGIVYGGKNAPMNIKLDHNALYHALRREAFHASILDLEIDGKAEQVLLRDFQMHAFKQLVLHVDFQRVDSSQPIHVKVPLHFINEDVSPAIKQSGVIHHAVTELDVSCLPGDLPEFVEIDMSAIEVGQAIRLSDIILPAGVTATLEDAGLSIANATAAIAPAEPAGEETEEK